MKSVNVVNECITSKATTSYYSSSRDEQYRMMSCLAVLYMAVSGRKSIVPCRDSTVLYLCLYFSPMDSQKEFLNTLMLATEPELGTLMCSCEN